MTKPCNLPPEELKVAKIMRQAFNMTRQRCYNPSNRDYPQYGGRGITICREWLDDFWNFYRDMGPRPKGMTLERTDNNGPYSKDNCVWATRAEQVANRRVSRYLTYNGETGSLLFWSRKTGIPYDTIKARINVLGYSVEEALEKPVKCGGTLAGRAYPKLEAKKGRALPRGYDCIITKFSKEIAESIRTEHASGVSITALSRKHNACHTTVSNIVKKLKAYSD